MSIISLADASLQRYRESITSMHETGKQALIDTDLEVLVKAYRHALAVEADALGYERISDSIPTYLIKVDPKNKNSVDGFSAFNLHLVEEPVGRFAQIKTIDAALPKWFSIWTDRSIDGEYPCKYQGDVDAAMNEYMNKYLGYETFPTNLLHFPVAVIALLINSGWKVTNVVKAKSGEDRLVRYTFGYGFRRINMVLKPSVVYNDWMDYRKRLEEAMAAKSFI